MKNAIPNMTLLEKWPVGSRTRYYVIRWDAKQKLQKPERRVNFKGHILRNQTSMKYYQ